MWFIRPKFEERYNVSSDIFINGTGISDGWVMYRWQDITACSIEASNPEELERYFGSNFHERPFSIFLTLKDGTRQSIILLGLRLEDAVTVGMAINHYSGREFISKRFIEGEPIPWQVYMGIIAFAAILAFITFCRY